MKKILTVALVTMIATNFIGCKEDDEAITRIEIAEGETINLNVGESQLLHVNHFPEHLKVPKNYSWKTSPSGIVYVSPGGEIKALAEGETVVTATLDNLTANCRVVVSPIDITGIKFDKADYEILIGDELQLQPTVSPATATYKNKLVYTSTDETIAKVTLNGGKIETIAAGECKIKVASPDGKIETDISIKVLPISLNQTLFEEIIGKQLQLQVSNMSEIYKGKLIYSSTNESVATVSADGLITNIGIGECVISATSADGKVKTECKVKVLPSEVSAISLNQTELTIMQSETFNFAVTIEPSYAADKTITWTTSDANTATIDANGTLTALEIGECIITAHSSNAEVTAQCSVKVITATVKEVTLDKSSLNIIVGATDNLTAIILPTAANQNVSWTSSNTSVATVENGVVTAIAAGSATITATSEEGGFSGNSMVTVEGLDKYLSASHIGGMTFSGAGNYAYCDCRLTNNSNVDIYVKSVIVNGLTYLVNETIDAYSTMSKRATTYQFNSTVYNVSWIVEYGGVEYYITSDSTSASYDEIMRIING